MSKGKILSDIIKDSEYHLAKYKFVLQHYPDAKLNPGYYESFSSKAVNKSYTNLSFYKKSYSVCVAPYSELEFEYNGKKEFIKVHSSPIYSKLVYLSWDFASKKTYIRFSRLKINLKRHDFKEDMVNACRVEIMEFIKNNHKYELNTKHLEPRLKKLLVLT